MKSNDILFDSYKLKLLVDIFSQSPIPSLIRKNTGEILLFNEAFSKLTGFTAEEMPDAYAFFDKLFDDDRKRKEAYKISKQISRRESDIRRAEFDLVAKDGSRKTVDLSIHCVFGDVPDEFLVIVEAVDITQKKNALRELQKSQETSKALLDAPTGTAILVENDGTILNLNQTAAKKLGATIKNLLGKKLFDIFPQELAGPRKVKHDRVITSGKPLSFEERFNDKYFETHIFPVFNERNDVDRLAIYSFDISRRKHAEEKLSSSEKKYRTLVQNLGFAICRITPENGGTFLEFNPAMPKMFGYKTRKEFMKVTPIELYLNPEDRNKFTEKMMKYDSVHNEELLLKKKDGTPIIVAVTSRVVRDENDKILYFDGIIEDITERKNAEFQLNFRYAFEKLISSISTQFINLTHDEIDSGITSALKSVVDFVKIDRGMILAFGSNEKLIDCTHEYTKQNKPLRNDIVDLDFTKHFPWLAQRVKKDEVVNIPSLESLPAAGKQDKVLLKSRNIQSFISVPMVTKGKALGVLIFSSEEKQENWSENVISLFKLIGEIFVNALQRKKNELALARFRTIMDQAAEGIYVIDVSNAEFIDVNDTACKMLGYTREELQQMRIDDITEYDTFGTSQDWMDYIRTIQSDGKLRTMSTVHRRKDNSIFPVEIIISLQKFEDQQYLLGVFHDKTESVRAIQEMQKLEEQLFQAQKLESIGRLAGGIAHDFNNIMSVILGHAEIIKGALLESGLPESGSAEAIIKGVNRAANLTQQLLGFARGGKYNPRPLDINKIIRDTTRVFEKIFQKKTEIVYNFDDSVSNVEADENQLGQVLTNIIVNAKDAMPNGGQLTFKTENLILNKKDPKKFPFLKEGSYVKLSISDTGTGMDADTKKLIFEPFFSTKDEAKGTGLGLATAYGIVSNHNGHIDVKSQLGVGTTFTILWPASSISMEKRKPTNTTIKHGYGNILIVDDEPKVRDLLKIQLGHLGYNIFSAKDGLEALKIYDNKKADIDLVVLDMIMPNMSGKETFERLLKLNSHIKVLILTGYTESDEISELIDGGAKGFLNKPYNLYELSDAVKNVLNE